MASNNTGDLTWGNLEDTEVFGRSIDSEDIIQIPRDYQNLKLKVAYEASHALIFARDQITKIFSIYSARAAILMQVRFDGYIGFPGGLVEAGEDPEFSLNRELEEEMNLDLTKYSIQLSNHVVSHYNKKTRLVTHFYAMEVSMEELNNIESRALQAKEYGFEVFGNIRVPLFTMGDGYRGFPNFLKHKFIGYAKEQLLFTLKCLDLMSEDEIQRALTAVQ